MRLELSKDSEEQVAFVTVLVEEDRTHFWENESVELVAESSSKTSKVEEDDESGASLQLLSWRRWQEKLK